MTTAGFFQEKLGQYELLIFSSPWLAPAIIIQVESLLLDNVLQFIIERLTKYI